MARQAAQRTSDDRPRQILAAALDCFTRKGFAATSIDDIRAASGASVGSIYHHFASKDGIAAALYEEGLRDYRDGLNAAVARADGAEALVRAIVGYHLDWAQANRDWARYLLSMRREQPVAAIEGRLRQSTGAFLRQVFARCREHVEMGELVAMPLELYAAQLIGPAQETIRLWLSGRSRVDPASARAALADAAWRALKSPDEETRG